MREPLRVIFLCTFIERSLFHKMYHNTYFNILMLFLIIIILLTLQYYLLYSTAEVAEYILAVITTPSTWGAIVPVGR